MGQYGCDNRNAGPIVALSTPVDDAAMEPPAVPLQHGHYGSPWAWEPTREALRGRMRVQIPQSQASTAGVDRMNELRARLSDEIPHLRRYARVLAGNADEADDLVQDCLERALSRASQWNPSKGARPWLFGILHNNFVSSVRKRRRQNELQRRYPPEETTHVNYEQHCDLDTVHAAVQKLPPDQRAAIILVAVSGLSYQEASEALVVPVGTIRSRLSRAREGLRSLLAARADTGPSGGHAREAVTRCYPSS